MNIIKPFTADKQAVGMEGHRTKLQFPTNENLIKLKTNTLLNNRGKFNIELTKNTLPALATLDYSDQKPNGAN
jgi:hypothetical protein